MYFSLLSSGLSRPDKKINNQLNISIKHSVLTWQQILLHKLRVRLGVGEESIVRFVLVDQVLSEESSTPGLGVDLDDDDLPLDDDDYRGDGHHQEDQQDEDDDVGVPRRAILAEIIQA